MFTLDTRIADALAERPSLRETLQAFHPAFSKLNHPVLGRILPRLVNVRDAARVAGVDPETLLAVMNLPGAPPPDAAVGHRTERTRTPAPPWLQNAVELDVRSRLAAGQEPFGTILAALRALPADGCLTVLAPFEPAPLIRLLGERGWMSHVTWEGDTCRASFRRRPEAEDPVARPAPLVLQATDAGHTLDVRGLEPPEPMRQILTILGEPDHLPLTVLHHREPTFLYPRLEELGLVWETQTVGDHVEIRIRAR